MKPRVLLVEDDPGLVMTLQDRLAEEGYDVINAANGDAALAHMARQGFELILLDVMLPHSNGFDVLRDLRRRGVRTPVLMLTARTQVVDRVVGLKLGADDYLTKPFAMMELTARMEALLRRMTDGPRSAGPDEAMFQFGPIRIDFRSTEVFRDGKPIELTAREFKLLRYFIERNGATLSRDELLNAVWGYDAMPVTRTVDVHVSWLRQKLEPDPRHPRFILTVHGLGYRFVTA